MTVKYDFAPCTLSLLALLAWGCAAPVAPEEPSSAGSSGQNAGNGGTNGGAGSNGGGGSGGRPTDPIDKVPGVTTPLEDPPGGCLNGGPAGTANFSLDAEVPSVLLEGTDGTLHANGIACTDASGAAIPIAGLTALAVTSDGAESGAVILDLASGDWSALLELPEAIQLEFPRGENGLVVRGTSDADFFRHGTRGTELVLDLVGDGRINVVATGVTGLGLSLGDGDDTVDDLAELLAERAAAEAAAAPPEEEPAEEDEVVAVTALALPLVAVGGDGNDQLVGGIVADDLDGGPGNDYVSYEARTSDLSIELCVSASEIGCSGDCSCEVMSGEVGEEDRLINAEDISTGSGNDTIMGSEASDVLSGGPGDDQIFGLSGSDVLYGEGGDDMLDGGADGDYCGATGQDEAVGCEL
jgi:Ca2+-binding RTX toxin-like protein